jgi:hypothetical protein
MKLKEPYLLSQVLNLTSVVLISIPLFTVIEHSLRSETLPEAGASATGSDSILLQPEDDVRPDIYYIVLDGYGREDILAELYDFRNDEFLEQLAQLGLYIAEESTSNYIQTALSLASSLNLTYLDELAEQLGPESVNRKPLNAMIKNNLVRDQLEGIGYSTIAFNNDLEATSLSDADYFWPSTGNPYFREDVPLSWWLTPFEGLLLETTMVRVFLEFAGPLQSSLGRVVSDPNYELHRLRIQYVFSTLPEIPKMEGDFFIFAHVVAPHPPFVFDVNGEPINPTGAFTYFDGSDYLNFVGPQEEYIRAYRDQLIYINTLVLESIRGILENSEQPPIIILQADHGPGAYLDWESFPDSNLEERIGILNAYYFPRQDYTAIYPSISPVNSFRVIFNEFFQTGFPLLEDRSYASPAVRPYRFSLITKGGTN